MKLTDRIENSGLVTIENLKYVSLSFISKDLMAHIRTELKARLSRLMVPAEIGDVTEFFEFNDTLEQATKAIDDGINDMTAELSTLNDKSL